MQAGNDNIPLSLARQVQWIFAGTVLLPSRNIDQATPGQELTRRRTGNSALAWRSSSATSLVLAVHSE